MAVDLNNADYLRFTTFASNASSSTTRVQLGERIPVNGGEGEIRRIKASSNWDFVGNIKRSAAKRAVNDEARELFRQTIANMFGGEDNIPPIVLDAMKLKDYGQGKPLTARRIIAVKRAIDRYVASEKSRLPNATATLRASAGKILDEYKHFNANEFNGRVESLVTYVGNDADLMEILKDKKVLSNVLQTVAGRDHALRDEKDVKAKVDALKANLDEIRHAANGKMALLKAGINAMIALGGKAMPKDIITQIIALANAANMDDVKKMTAKSDMATLHKGVLQYVSNLERITLATKAMSIFTGAAYGDELAKMRRFVGCFLFANCDTATLRAIQKSLTSDACGKLSDVYSSIEWRFNELPAEITGEIDDAISAEFSERAGACDNNIRFMKEIVDDAIGADGKVPKSSAERNGVKVALNNPIFRTISPSLKAAAEESIKNKQDSVIDQRLFGNGQGSDVIRNAMRNRMGTQRLGNAGVQLQMGFDQTVGSMINWNIMKTCKTAATDVMNTDAIKDLASNDGKSREITIGGVKLSGNAKDALDQITSFVTNGEKKTYDELDANEKAKVHIVLSFISRKAQTDSYDGITISLSPQLNKMPYNCLFDEKSEKTKIDISFNDRGGLVVSLKYERPVRAVVEENGIFDDEDKERSTEGRTITTEYTYTLDSGEFTKISGLNFAEFNDTQAQQIAQSDGANKMANAVKTFKKEFIINDKRGICNANFKAELN